jgi:hypothetical protein
MGFDILLKIGYFSSHREELQIKKRFFIGAKSGNPSILPF